MMELTRARTLELLERAVQEQGTDHTAFCEYMFSDWNEDTNEVVFTGPQCIVGYVVHYLDESDSTLEMLNSDYQGSRVNSVHFANLGIETELGVVEILDAAQYAQDGGETWGEALEAAQYVFQVQEQRTADLKNFRELNH